MKHFVALGVVVATLSSFCAGSARAADAPLRHVVFNFTYGTTSDMEVHDSGIGSGGSGTTDYSGGDSDKGTITVDVLKVESDRSLLLMVSEHAEKTRSATPARCVVYATTIAVCDANVTVHPEELTAIRFLAPDFVDPTRIDAKKHWQVALGQGASSDTSDFTISQNDGGKMVIDEARVSKQQVNGRDVNVTTSATINYDFLNLIPTGLQEFSMSREPQGMDKYMTRREEVTLKLASDSGVQSH